ncbi:MAG: epoxyqueuosine reductase QueH [Bacillota bacterium]
MKTLLHTCCAPCSIQCVESLRQEGVEPVMFWYNPNIHPFTEYEGRRNALRDYASIQKLELIEQGGYGLRRFIAGVGTNFDERCEYCYSARLKEVARYAAEHGFDCFSTTLLISPYQKHERIREIGEREAAENNVRFLYRDFRPLFRAGQQSAREMNLYMQKYCGCIFSEEERYRKRQGR